MLTAEHVREGKVLDDLKALAEEQRGRARRGEFPFQHDWVQALDSIRNDTKGTSHLRLAGIANLRGTVRDAVSNAVDVSVIHDRVRAAHGAAVSRQQIHRALHSLMDNRQIERVSRGVYAPIPTPAKSPA